MIDRYGFGSIKLKGGVFEPEAGDRGHARAGRRVPEPPAAGRPERRLDGRYLDHGWPRNSTASWSTWRTRRPASRAWPRWPSGRACRWPPTCAWSASPICRPPSQHGSVGIVLSDHHYWGGLRQTQALSVLCETFGIGLSMHSNSHLGISLAAMVHVAAATPHLTYACDTHWPWKTEDVIVPGALDFVDGAIAVPSTPGLGVELDEDALAGPTRTSSTAARPCATTRRTCAATSPTSSRTSPGGETMWVTGYSYPWDVADDPGFADRAKEIGVDEVAIAASYHSTRAATPFQTRPRPRWWPSRPVCTGQFGNRSGAPGPCAPPPGPGPTGPGQGRGRGRGRA